jgi:hypothetical protein
LRLDFRTFGAVGEQLVHGLLATFGVPRAAATRGGNRDGRAPAIEQDPAAPTFSKTRSPIGKMRANFESRVEGFARFG